MFVFNISMVLNPSLRVLLLLCIIISFVRLFINCIIINVVILTGDRDDVDVDSPKIFYHIFYDNNNNNRYTVCPV